MATNFFTCADRGYWHFILPYILSSLITNPGDTCEIITQDHGEYIKRNEYALDQLREYFPERYKIRGGDFSRPSVNSVRFLETPILDAEYTYIGDIDIIVTEQVSQQHIEKMHETGLPYSNILRPDGIKLSGLHFTKTREYFNLDRSNVKLNQNDEIILCDIVRPLGLPDPDETWRPMHGLHLSQNRRPIGGKSDPGWGIDKRPAVDAYVALSSDPRWVAARSNFAPRFKLLLLMLQSAIEARYPSLADINGPKVFMIPTAKELNALLPE